MFHLRDSAPSFLPGILYPLVVANVPLVGFPDGRACLWHTAVLPQKAPVYFEPGHFFTRSALGQLMRHFGCAIWPVRAQSGRDSFSELKAKALGHFFSPAILYRKLWVDPSGPPYPQVELKNAAPS